MTKAAMSPTDLEILRDALHCLRTYRRNAPPDLKPYGRHGHKTDTVISNLELVIAKHNEIPQLRPVTRRCVTLDKEAWR